MATSDLERAARGSNMTEATCKESLQVRHTHELTTPAAAMREAIDRYGILPDGLGYAMVDTHANDGLGEYVVSGTRAECQSWIDTLAAEAAIRAHEAQRWMPIETAPRDGTNFLAFGSGRQFSPIVRISHYVIEARAFFHEGLTHWMPLPAPPAEGRE